MIKQISLICRLFLLFISISNLHAEGNEKTSTELAVAHLRFEQNITDQDVEVVIEAKGGTEGLEKLTVVAPDGRKIVDVTAPDAKTFLGLRHFSFESPEPKEINRLKQSYPEGEYQFVGMTSSGAKLTGKSTLSHVLAEPVSFLHPKADAENVPIKNLEITWSPVKNAIAYIVSIEQPETDVNFTAKLTQSTTSLTIPNGWLLPGTEYHLAIGTVTEKGNITYLETSFTTETVKEKK